MKTKTKPARNPTIFRGGANTKKLYGILHKLECELQELGVRPDFGLPTDPEFAAETLADALKVIAGEADAAPDLLHRIAKNVEEDVAWLDEKRNKVSDAEAA